ncbi:MAG: hypothetical protein AAB368_06555, partial [bacterium]
MLVVIACVAVFIVAIQLARLLLSPPALLFRPHACAEYPDNHAVVASLAVQAGRIPPYLPVRASAIHECHEVGGDSAWIAFRIGAGEVDKLVARMGRLRPEIARELRVRAPGVP